MQAIGTKLTLELDISQSNPLKFDVARLKFDAYMFF